jgi:hypothetical protein
LKNQYFGDINDYRKYGLIRALQVEAQLKVLVAWMLTPNDQRRDGKLRSYLREPDQWLRFDPELYRGLTSLLNIGVTPRVDLIEKSSLLGTADYFSEIVPDATVHREAWAGRLLKAASESEFVFLDPDNGLEVPSRPLGRKGSSKYAYWPEVAAIWEAGASVLIYQHFRREKRETFVPRMVGELRERTGAVVEAFHTPHVLFLLASQPKHSRLFRRGIGRVGRFWKHQISAAGFMAN